MFLIKGALRIQTRTFAQLLGPLKNVLVQFYLAPTQQRLLFCRHQKPHLDIGLGDTNKKQIIDLPLIHKVIENPQTIQNEIDDIISRITDLRLPAPTKNLDESGIQAARLIVIRRKKMKKHKLKKLRKRMKYAWAKVKQRREQRKEKAFQAELSGRIKEAEKFSAEAYVTEKLERLNDSPVPKYWKGKRLPTDIVKELMQVEQLKKQKHLAKLERIERYRNWKL